MRRYNLIWYWLFTVMLTACNPYFRKSKEMERALEQAKAVYGDGNLEIEVDTVLFVPGLSEAPAFFAGKKQYDKAALAALLNGYTEKDFDKEAAMLSFKDAEHYGELAQDSLTMARAEYWMGKFLYEEGRKEEALLMLKDANDYIGICNTNKAIIENSLATVYIMLNQLDSAEICLQNSLLHAQTGCLDYVEWKVLNNYSVLYRIQGKYHQALDCLGCISKSLDNTKKTLVYLNYGNIYMDWGDVDSASIYYNRLDELLAVANVNNETKVSAYGALLYFSENQKNDSLALQYYEKYESALFKVMSQRQEQVVYRIQKQYDYEALQNKLNKKIILRHQIILIISVLLLALALTILVLQHRHKQMLENEKELKRRLYDLKKDLQQTVKLTVIDGMVVSRLKNILVANRTMNRVKDPRNDWRPLVFDVKAGKENTFEAARSIIEIAYPNIYSVILEKHPDLSETEAKVCLLSCFDLSNAEIAELLGLSINTINQNRSLLRKKLNLKSEKLSEQLHEIVSK